MPGQGSLWGAQNKPSMVSASKTNRVRRTNMQPGIWRPPVELSEREDQIARKIRKAKLFLFLRQHRHIVLDEAFQQELASLYRPAERGQPPVAPAMLALALILEAYTGVSDDEVIEATMMDRRWGGFLEWVGNEEGAFRKRKTGGVRPTAHLGEKEPPHP